MRDRLTTTTGTITFSWRKTVWLYFILTPIFFIDVSSIDERAIALTTTLLFLTVGIGHSVGLHRGVIHKSYRTSRTFRNISMYLFVLTGMGSPLSWLKQHYYRDYWQNRGDCPSYFQYKQSFSSSFY